MRKVLIVTSVASMVDQFLIPNINLLQNNNIEVHIATNFLKGNNCSFDRIEHLKKRLKTKGVHIHQIDFDRKMLNFKENMKAMKQLKKVTTDNTFDYIHAHSPIGGVCARIVGRLKKTKVIYTAHGFHFYKGSPIKNWVMYYPVEKLLSIITHTIITINKEDYEIAKNKFYSRNVEYIPGVGIKSNKKNESDKLNILKELEIPEKSRIMLSVGELNDNKNHEFILESMSEEFIKNNIYYIICGQGEKKEYYQEKIRKMNLEKNVFFLGFREDVKELYSIADLFVFPSKREGLPVSIMEAMNNELAVVCSKIRGNIDLIDNEKGGEYLDLKDQVKTRELIKNLLSIENEKKLLEYGAYNSKKAKKYDISIINEMLLNVYGLQNDDKVISK